MKIDQFIKERYCDESGSGNPLTLHRKDGRVRLVFQNPRGVLKRNKENGLRRDGYMDSGALEQLRNSDIDIVGLAETNINWKISGPEPNGAVLLKNLDQAAECLFCRYQQMIVRVSTSKEV